MRDSKYWLRIYNLLESKLFFNFLHFPWVGQPFIVFFKNGKLVNPSELSGYWSWSLHWRGGPNSSNPEETIYLNFQPVQYGLVICSPKSKLPNLLKHPSHIPTYSILRGDNIVNENHKKHQLSESLRFYYPILEELYA